MLLIDAQLLQRVHAASSAEDLHGLVQGAIALEHSTIPPYLCAYFTLRPGANEAVADVIRSVVIEEMLHLTIACNLLVALGGTPRIGGTGFIPTYPGHLPMNVNESLVVRLRKCSIEQVQDVFMEIEEPEDPRNFPVAAAAAALGPAFATIGQFYGAIADKIDELGQPAFKGDFGREVVATEWFEGDEIFRITGPESARQAIRIIVEQGEGTALAPVDPDGEIAHYYRFEEIVKGRKLVKDTTVPEGWSFSGAPVVLDPAGVWNMQDDPVAAKYPPGSRARLLVDQFNASYTRLLMALDAAFNGMPDKMNDAIGLMYDLRLLAHEVLQTSVPGLPGVQAGLPFQYTNTAV